MGAWQLSNRPVVFVIYASFALVESILPMAVELHARGNPLHVVQLAGNSNEHVRAHSLYVEILQSMSVYRDFSRRGTIVCKFLNVFLFIAFLARLRICRGRIVFIHREKNVHRLDRLISRFLKLFGRSYAFPTNQGVLTPNRAKWLIRDNEKIVVEARRARRQTINDISPEVFLSRARCATKLAPTQPMLIFTEAEEPVFRDILMSRDQLVAIGIPRLYPSWPLHIAENLERHLANERVRLSIPDGARIVTLAMTYIDEPWFKTSDAPEKFVRSILKAMQRHMPDAYLVLKAKPSMFAEITAFAERMKEERLVVSICPLPILARGSVLGVVVASAAVYEFLFAHVPTIDLLDPPSQLTPVLGWWDDIPGIYKARGEPDLDELVSRAASNKLTSPDRDTIAHYFRHDASAFDRFLLDA